MAGSKDAPTVVPVGSTGRRIFPDISPFAYEHPTDRAALVALRKMTGFDLVLRKVLGAVGERRLRLLFLANGVRVGENQMPNVHKLLIESCETLDVQEIPELYLVQSPEANAMALGVDRPFIVVNAALVKTLSEDELRCVIGHEVAHILSGHALYRSLLALMLFMARWSFPGLLTAVALPILVGLREWQRKSELSADRAGLLVSHDVEVSRRIITKLAGGVDIDGFDPVEYARQADEYQNDGTMADSIFKIMNLLWMSHPFPVLRLKELNDWNESERYKNILAGIYPRRSEDDSSIKDEFKDAAASYRKGFSEASDSLSMFVKDVAGLGEDLLGRFFKRDKKDAG